MQPCPPGEPHDADHRDRRDRDHDVPRPVAQRVRPERRADVVRQEQRRERDHDQVVEEERPPGHEAEQVVVRAPRERLGTAGLRDRSGSLGVRERDEAEDDPRRGTTGVNPSADAATIPSAT